jgi:hypothetical protein
MSIDRADFAAVTTEAQSGGLQSFWPIIITTAGIALQTEIEVNIVPCDAIWMPSIYDLGTGKHPVQPPPDLPSGWEPPPYVPDSITVNGVEVPTVGCNPCDVYHNGVLVQSAPVFSIRVNSPNNPWLLFGQSTQIGTAFAAANAPNLIAGCGGCMRSLTGPISRLWVKFYKFGTWDSSTLPPLVRQGIVNDGQSVIVLMSSLGFMQQTVEYGRTWDDTSPGMAGTQYQTLAWAQVISSGGYQTPQLNTADKRFLGVA